MEMEVTLKGLRKKAKDEAAVEGVRDEQSRQVMRSKAGGEKGLSICHRGSRPELGLQAWCGMVLGRYRSKLGGLDGKQIELQGWNALFVCFLFLVRLLWQLPVG